MGPHSHNKKPQTAKNFGKSLRKLVRYFAPFKVRFSAVIATTIIGAFFGILGPQLIGDMITAVTDGVKMTAQGVVFLPNFDKITQLGLTLIALYFASALFNYIQGWIMTTISQKITFKMREQLSQKISKLPLKYFDNVETGNIVSLVTNDIETISQNLSQSFVQIISAIVTVIGVAIMMLRISWEMTLIAAVIMPVSIAIIAFITKSSQRYFSDLQRNTGSMNGHTEEIMGAHEIMKAYNGEEKSISTFNKINDNLFKSAWKSQFFGGMMYPVMGFIGNLGNLTVAVVGGVRAINGQISIGDISAFMQYMNQFTQPLTQVASSMTVVQTTVAAAERVFEFLESQEEIKTNVKASLPENISGAVEFKKVNFSYQKDKPIISNFTAKIKPKQNVAIVGPTGAGKTTLVNLLMRFYEIDSGEILIDGINNKDLSRQDVRSLFGMVLQDTWLFNGTIAENLSYGRPDATRKEIIQAAKAAHADHFIKTLPNGYDTIISEDVDNVSAGEKQLLTIARAILADAPMMILDEATSSVDTRTEAAIQSAMDKLTHGRTSFVIAHRLSTIKNADLILVMDKGNIVEQGNHKQLLKLNGRYASLYNSQFSEGME
ncbi:ABC transporter ATP-binding protein [Candidatus Saccharibacteria bacterium]|nr:ABC transporter ATP-binding protein [Candidatus Saccharibacteria bacterium]MBP9552455.1 ABC transporter ATP-binding protein [Candidatus Saccharibacteria bacterium]